MALQAHADFRKLKKKKKWLTEEDAGLPVVPEVPTEDKLFESIALAASQPAADVAACVKKVERHYAKLRFEQRRERKTLDMAQDWEEEGANVAFRETATQQVSPASHVLHPVCGVRCALQ